VLLVENTNINEIYIRDWRKKTKSWCHNVVVVRGLSWQKVKYPEIEKQLCKYVTEKQQFRCAVSTVTIFLL
jgi:hypothetical protein